MSVSLRPEAPADISAIHALNRAAFGGETEAKLIDRLRDNGDHILSLVAEENGHIIGHALFTALHAPFRALALAPVAVSPSHQKRGIGSRLIEHGHHWARENDWDALFVLGEPAYYSRFGYDAAAARGFSCPYAGEYFMMKALCTSLPERGELVYPSAFGDIA